MIEDLHSDVLLQIFSFLSAKDSGITVQCCKRFLYLLETFRSKFLQPELVACSTMSLSRKLYLQSQQRYCETVDDDNHNNDEKDNTDLKRITRSAIREKNNDMNEKLTPDRVLKQMLSEIRSPPNVAFCFYSSDRARQEFLDSVESLLPSKNVTILSALSQSGIQSNIRMDTPTPLNGNSQNDDTLEENDRNNAMNIHNFNNMKVEATSDFSCMMGNFPNAHFVPFCIHSTLELEVNKDTSEEDSNECYQGVNVLKKMLHGAYMKTTNDNNESMKQDYKTETEIKTDNDNVEKENDFWKVFIVYVVGSGYRVAEDFLQELQEMYPNAAIVGGVCDEGDISLDPAVYDPIYRDQLNKKTMSELKRLILVEWGRKSLHGLVEKRDLVNFLLEKMLGFKSSSGVAKMAGIKNGIFGLAIGGAVPVRSIVSRGLRSSTSGKVGPNDSQWSVEKACLVQPSDSIYPYNGPANMLKPVHLIETIRDLTSGEEISARQFIVKCHMGNHHPQYIGIKTDKQRVKMSVENGVHDGFQVHMFNASNFINDNIVIMSDGTKCGNVSIQKGSFIDLFELDGKACNEDLENTLIRLKEQLQNEKLLGSIMYSCSGRGPNPGLLEDTMADAKKFAKHFPFLPCVGLYAGGEIGPVATFGNKDVFRRGKVALQGFTAVFAVFVVPKRGPTKYNLNDSKENIQKFIEKRF